MTTIADEALSWICARIPEHFDFREVITCDENIMSRAKIDCIDIPSIRTGWPYTLYVIPVDTGLRAPFNILNQLIVSDLLARSACFILLAEIEEKQFIAFIIALDNPASIVSEVDVGNSRRRSSNLCSLFEVI